MMTNIDHSQSVLARLLAKENIKIQHGNYTTAFFDVKNRILGLPMWKNKGKDVYDLLCGHEVGHALYTPSDAFDQNTKVRKDLLNVVEDVRIERLIQDTYPGLTRCFRSAYAQLKADNFFGINGRDVNTLGFADRINLKAKLGSSIEIRFSHREEEIRQTIHAAETWQQVLEATALLEKYLNETQIKPVETPQPDPQSEEDGQQEPPEGQSGSDSQAEESPSAADDSSAKGQTSAEDDASDESADEGAADGVATNDESDDDSTEDEEISPSAGTPDQAAETSVKSERDEDSESAESNGDLERNAMPTSPDNCVVETQTAFETNAKTLLDTSHETLSTLFAQAPTQKEFNEVVIPYKFVAHNRSMNPSYVEANTNTKFQTEFLAFMKQTRKAVAVLVKEFELRKAAYQYSRASVSKTGSLNVERLHAYKVSDDLFLSVTKLADAKNHAMMMFVDFSGSMQSVLPHVLKHLINMSLFCRNLGIPFRVYGFTSDNFFTTPGRTPYFLDLDQIEYDRVMISNLNLIELVSSELSKSDFNDAIKALWLRSVAENFSGTAERLGNTPLNESLVVAHKLVKEFKAKYNPDRMIAIFLTDGEGQHLRTAVAPDNSKVKRIQPPSAYHYHSRVSFKLNGRSVSAPQKDLTPALIENLRVTTNCEVIGFFIPSSMSMLRKKVIDALTLRKVASNNAWTIWLEKEKEYKDMNFLSIPGGFNYSNFFIVASGDELAIDDDEEIPINEHMTRTRMARVFTKYSKVKRTNRVFVSKFAEALA